MCARVHAACDWIRGTICRIVDPYMGINDDLLVYVKPQMEIG
ncbi:hypothetical protein BVRB_6g147900 isoform A [Beta vulgaris subsp. vulgaris]|nr:hypothetical protein BVRB_6g147900 isoform A [Beta vulgaris subsp. vulgaris]